MDGRADPDVATTRADANERRCQMSSLERHRTRRAPMNDHAIRAVVGMVANDFSVANLNDPGMLDVVGFDSATPQLVSDFARGAL
jgi:hypothetical protein